MSRVTECWCGSSSAAIYLEGRFNRTGDVDRPFRILRCTACGTKRSDPSPDDTQYSDPARDPALSHDGAPYAPAHLALLRSVKPSGRYLDLGCNQGHLVEAAAKSGYHAVGVDIDPYSTGLARASGRDVVTGTIDDVEGPFDLISMIHVAEHVTALPALVARAAERLAPGGRLVVVVPNHRSIVARLMGEKWLFWAPREHVWHFDARTIVTLFERSAPLRAERVVSRRALEVFPRTVRGAAGRVVQRVASWLQQGEQLEAVFVRTG